MKRGKKKLTIVNIVKKIREKKVVAVILVVLYFAADYAQDGVIGSSPVETLSVLQFLH